MFAQSIKTQPLAVILALLVSVVAVQCDAEKETQSPDRILLGVYMESLCPDTRRFFNQQLVPTYREIGQIMELRLVPFGHAQTLGDGKMSCQHGPRECEGNRRMACILDKSANQSETLETLGCIFRGRDSNQNCINNNMQNVTYEQVENCTQSRESYDMMVEAEKATGYIGYVPHLTVNNETSDEIQDQAEHHLKNFLCKQNKGSVPVKGC